MSDATADMSLQESCKEAARHLSVEVHLLASKADELERENAKLRELARDMWRGMCGYGHNCLACEHYLPRDVAPSECEFFTRIHELGIEVD